MLVETFLRKQLGLKAHTVTKVEETEQYMIVHIDRLGVTDHIISARRLPVNPGDLPDSIADLAGGMETAAG